MTTLTIFAAIALATIIIAVIWMELVLARDRREEREEQLRRERNRRDL